MRILSNLNVSGFLDIDTINNAAADTDKFLVADANGVVKFRTGAEVASDIGASVGYVSTVKHEVKLGEAIAKGQAVYVTSSDGTNMIVSKASNVSDVTSSKTLGLLETGGATNAKVFAITEGLLAGLDTSTATAGAPVWLGTDGNLLYGLAAKPVAPAHMVFIGIVTRVNANNGEIFVKVQNGFELEELHNVLITGTPVDKAVIQYDLASGLWKNSTISGIIGSGTTNYLPKFTGASTIGNSVIHESAGGNIGIGNTNNIYRLDVSGSTYPFKAYGTNGNGIILNPSYNYYDAYNHIFRSLNGTTTYATIDNSGNLGLGVTPSAWSVLRGLQVGLTASVSGYAATTEGAFFSSNSFYDGGAFKYQVTGFASTLLQINGEHRFQTAASGTAGGAITFTRPMTLTANGRLLLGTTTEGTNLLDVNGSARLNNILFSSTAPFFTGANMYSSGSNLGIGTTSANVIGLFTNNTERMRIDANGSVGIGTTSPGSLLHVQGTATATLARFVAPGNVTILLSRAGTTDNGDASLSVTNTGALGITAATAIRFISASTQYGAFVGTTGNLLLQNGGTFTDSGQRLQVTGDGYFSGSVGIGTTATTIATLTLQKVLSGTNLIGVYNLGQIQSTNGNTSYYQSEASTSATAITVTNLRHFFATTSSFGAGSAVTNQFGFSVQSSMVGATNNYGFFGDIASGTGRWNLYMNGSASNLLMGNTGIGAAPVYKFDVQGTTNTVAIRASSNTNNDILYYGTSTVTGNIYAFLTAINATGNAMMSLQNNNTVSGNSLIEAVVQSASTGDPYIGFTVSGATNWSIGIDNSDSDKLKFGNVSNPSNGATTLVLHTTGNTSLGAVTDTGEKLQVTGTMKVTGASTFGGNLGGANQRVANFRNSGGNAFIELQSSGSGAVALWAASANEFGIYQNATAGTIGTNVLYVTSAANIGIGTFTPSYKLDVQGTLGVTGAATFSSTIRATNLGIGRDADLQTNYGVISIGGTSGTFYRAFTGSTETFRIQTSSTTTNVQAFGGDLRIDTGGQNYAMLLTSGGGIGIGVTAVNASAKLQVESVTQGFLPPRMTAAQRGAIATPSVGLVVYQTDGVEGLYIYTNTNGWKSLAIVN